MSEDIVRVLRVVEYIGPRSVVEEQVRHSIHGTRFIMPNTDRELKISAVTVGEFAEVLAKETTDKLYPGQPEPEGYVPPPPIDYLGKDNG